ncbi:RabGAP/TBC [Apiospora kogelbergensis]|uniref:GTPase-activating protein GYP5 n=1 Tax=Apiospora kogelbergensis TaxID=1337665 RepID=A0AAW0R9D1_9PEZI
MAEQGEAQVQQQHTAAAAPPAVEVQQPPREDDESAFSDREDNDTFEDAVDARSVRSLTKRSSSVQKPAPSPPLDDDEPEAVPDVPTSDAVPQPETEKVHTNGNADVHNDDDEDAPAPPEKDAVEATIEDDLPRDPKRVSSVISTGTLDEVKLDDVKLDDVKLDDSKIDDETASQPKEDEPPAVPPKRPSKKLSLSNLTSSLPSMPWSPSAGDSPPKDGSSPPTVPASAPASTRDSLVAEKAPAPLSRKLTSPFTWLSSRNSKDSSSLPTNATRSTRRDTASSMATLSSNPEMMLSKLEEGDEAGARPRSVRNSLKDRFKLVRMREEAGIIMPDDDGSIHATQPATAGDATSLAAQALENGPLSPIPPSPNPEMAPGTVSGVMAGPSAINDSQVDWDLWQNVVYEGPAAVARTSAEELNQAIATGIPNVIRGVVWQVLAQSKNDDLELAYRELLTRGTERDQNRNSNSTISTLSNGNLSIDKDAVTSSASSVHSDKSGSNGTKSPAPSEKDIEAVQRAQAVAAAEKKKNAKEDVIKVQKLERVIRKDMGARTSYSKHAQAAGLQDGLFGVCKAYALYDEDVGYAQGMNFLIMPILFNMPEEEAFCLLVKLMHEYKLRDLFVQDMPGLHMRLYQFERLLEDLEPALYCHLHRRGITGHLYATQWFLTLFAYRFPLQLVLRIYDLILSEGLAAILKFGIVLMQKNKETLLGMSDMGALTTHLKDKLFDVYVDQAPSAGSILENGFFGSSSASVDKEVYRADQLVRDACEVKVTPELLKAYTAEWVEKTRAEKERQQELDTLKTQNASYAIQVRKLEKHVEDSERDQVEMANQFVRFKLREEKLEEENEGLDHKVKELSSIINEQQNTDKQLVATKMQLAELTSEHEALKRKWAELKKQFA